MGDRIAGLYGVTTSEMSTDDKTLVTVRRIEAVLLGTQTRVYGIADSLERIEALLTTLVRQGGDQDGGS